MTNQQNLTIYLYFGAIYKLLHVTNPNHTVVNISPNLKLAMAAVSQIFSKTMGTHTYIAFSTININFALPHILVIMTNSKEFLHQQQFEPFRWLNCHILLHFLQIFITKSAANLQ